MAYTKTTWLDRVVQFPYRYTKSGESASEVTLIRSPGTVTESGTPVNAANLNKMEDEILYSSVSANIYQYKNIGGSL